MSKRVERADLWTAMKTAKSSATIVCVLLPPEWLEDIARTPEERDQSAALLENFVRGIPSLLFYARIGLYTYVGIADATVSQIGEWANAYTDLTRFSGLFRVGLATAGSDGIRTMSELELGTHKSARSNPSIRVFGLSAEPRRVVPYEQGINREGKVFR